MTFGNIIVALAIAAAASAAQAQQPEAAAPAGRGTPPIGRLVIADEQGDHGLPTPFTHAPDGLGFTLMTLVYDSLLWRDREGQLVPALARQWHEGADHRSVEFTLEPQARWHDGKPVTAQDVAFTFAYFRRHPNPFLDVGAVDGVDDLGAGRVRVRLGRVDAAFVPQLAASLPVLPAHVFGEMDEPRRIKTDGVIGSGPYRLTGYDKAGGRYRFTAWEGYYQGRPRVREIVFMRMEPALALQALRRGEADLIQRLPLPLVPQARGMAKVVTAHSGHPIRLRFNFSRPPFDDKRLRHAIARGIDREALLRVVEGGLGEVSAGRFLRGSSWQAGEPLAAYAHDAQAARRLLKEAGYAPDDQGRLRGTDGRPLAVGISATRGHARLAAALADQLEKLGLATSVRLLERNVLAADLSAGAFDLALVMQSANGDPGNMARHMTGTAPFCDGFRARPDLLDLLARQAEAADVAQRRALIEQAQAIYAQELPSFYLYSPYWAEACGPKLCPWFTPGGFAFGIPLPLNKLNFTQ